VKLIKTPAIQRQKNVQQQNRATEAEIRRIAAYWRNGELPKLLQLLGNQRGIDWDRSIVVKLEADFPGMYDLICGQLLTQDERFINFELETKLAHTELIAVSEWDDVTSAQNLDCRNRGIGAARGALAIKVLRELNE
jgi:hypothetical protein